MNQVVDISREESEGRDEAPADCTPLQLAERRYVHALAAMVEHAESSARLELLVDKLAATLADIGFRCGPRVAGDILAKFGNHLTRIAATRLAEEEAERARKKGGAFH